MKFLVETPWDVQPDSSSIFEIYNPSDQYIMGNGVDKMQKFDGTDWQDLEGDTPRGNILAIYKFRLMVAGDPSFPHRIWYSHLRNGEGWTKDTDWIDVYPEDGGKINGFEIQGDELKVSKDNGRFYGWQIFDDGRPEASRLRIIEDNKGALNQQSLTMMDDILYYLDRERLETIPVSTRGGISYVVDEIIKGIESLDKTAMGSNDGKVYVALGDITIDLGDEITITNAVLIYDYINQGFYIRDNVEARVFSKFIDSTGVEDMYFGDSNGRVFKMDSGTLAGASPLHMRIRTVPYFRDTGDRIHISKVGIFMDDPDATVVNYRTELNEKFVHNLGTVIKEPVQWFPCDITGPLLQFEFTHSNRITRPRLLGIEIEYEPRGKPE